MFYVLLFHTHIVIVSLSLTGLHLELPEHLVIVLNRGDEEAAGALLVIVAGRLQLLAVNIDGDDTAVGLRLQLLGDVYGIGLLAVVAEQEVEEEVVLQVRARTTIYMAGARVGLHVAQSEGGELAADDVARLSVGHEVTLQSGVEVDGGRRVVGMAGIDVGATGH